MNAQFGIWRFLIATGVAAVPFAILPVFGKEGIVVAVTIALCAFLVALLARQYQLRSLKRLGYGGLFGWFMGQIFVSPHYRPIEQAEYQILFVMFGFVLGAFFAFPVYCEYHSTESNSKTNQECN